MKKEKNKNHYRLRKTMLKHLFGRRRLVNPTAYDYPVSTCSMVGWFMLCCVLYRHKQRYCGKCDMIRNEKYEVEVHISKCFRFVLEFKWSQRWGRERQLRKHTAAAPPPHTQMSAESQQDKDLLNGNQIGLTLSGQTLQQFISLWADNLHMVSVNTEGHVICLPIQTDGCNESMIIDYSCSTLDGMRGNAALNMWGVEPCLLMQDYNGELRRPISCILHTKSNLCYVPLYAQPFMMFVPY